MSWSSFHAPPWSKSLRCPLEIPSGGLARLQRSKQRLRSGHRTENAALCLDHGQARLVEFRKIRRAAVRQRDAAEAAVVSLADRGVDANLGGHATYKQSVDAAVVQHQFEIGLVERALSRLVDDRFGRERIKLRNNVVTRLAANENATHW